MDVQHVSSQRLILTGTRRNRRLHLGAGDQIDQHMLWIYFNIRLGFDRLDQRSLYFPTRQIVRVQDTVLGMTAFARQVIILSTNAGKLCAQVDQPTHTSRAFSADEPYHILVAQSPARFQSVLNMQIARVVIGHYRCDTALGIAGG